MSVGVVAPFDYLFKGRTDYAQTYREEVDACAAVKDRVALGETGDRVFRDEGLLVPGQTGRR